MAERTGGVLGDLCTSDLASVLTEVSLEASRLREIFFLQYRPAVPSLVVTVDGVEIEACTGEWVYDLVGLPGEEEPAVVFDRAHLPPPDAEISVQYYQGDGDPADYCAEEAAR